MKHVLLAVALLASTPAIAGGGGCAETCSLSDAAESQSEIDFRQSLSAWMKQDMATESLPLDTLLYYRESTALFLSTLDNLMIDPERRVFLMQELARTEVTVEMRIVDDTGAVRGSLVATDIPFREKQHLRFEATGSLGHLESGGRVRRVGLSHLWSRW
jgi:hypothetical protein